MDLTTQIAYELGVTREYGVQFIAAVHERTDFTAPLADVLDILRGLRSKQRHRDRVVDETAAILRIGRLVGVDAYTAVRLPGNIQERVGYPITPEVILATIRALDGNATVPAVIAYLEKLSPIVELARLLKTTEPAAIAFKREVEERLGRQASFADLRRVIQGWQGPGPTAVQVANQLGRASSQRTHHSEPPLRITIDEFDARDNSESGRPSWLKGLPESSLRFMRPEPLLSETWISTLYMEQLITAVKANTPWYLPGILGRLYMDYRLEQQRQRLHRLARICWAEILSSRRRYQVPSRGQAEILAGDELAALIDLVSVRFVAEGASSPALFIRFEFDQPGAIGLLSVRSDGVCDGFSSAVSSAWFRDLIRAVALSYYRDLVVPDEPYVGPSRFNRRSGGLPSFRPSSPRSRHNRSLPRRPGRTRRRAEFQLEHWYEALEHARHYVTGHTRYVRPGYIASPEKQRQARRAGVTLQPGYTWVINHDRGNPTYTPMVELDGEDLLRRTIFHPPRRASAALRRILQ